MSRHRREVNLDGLCMRLGDYAKENGIGVPDPLSGPAARLSDTLHLAHSTSDAKFANVCASGYLVSAARLAASRGKSLAPACTEVVLGTADFVFFYLSPFRYPGTNCGFLFAKSLESHHVNDGVATPFDSGGLMKACIRRDPTEPPREFLSRHELPVPDHRRYLGLSMGVLFDKPEDYIEGPDPPWQGPIGLTGGDQRRWTHEVRIPDRVPVRGSHLQAVFAPRMRVAADPEIESLFEWCSREGVDGISFDTPHDAPHEDEFKALQRTCLDYIRRKLY
jgi:hypothetical protein